MQRQQSGNGMESNNTVKNVGCGARVSGIINCMNAS